MALVCADTWARQADKGPVKSKSPADVAAVFERLLARTKGELVVVSTDGGAEFKCVRAEMHGRRPIAQSAKSWPHGFVRGWRRLKRATWRELDKASRHQQSRPCCSPPSSGGAHGRMGRTEFSKLLFVGRQRGGVGFCLCSSSLVFSDVL